MFSDLISALDLTVLSTFTENQLSVYDSSRKLVATGDAVVKNPVMEEDYVPGSQPGPSMLLLFVRLADFPGVVKGWVGTFGGVDYDIGQVDVDREGGATLRMRRRSP